MSKAEIMITTYGEMCDMIACEAIFNGAEAKKKPRSFSFDEAMALK